MAETSENKIKERELKELLRPELLAELKRVELRTRRVVDADLLGSYRSAFRGTGLVFSDVREYQPGDEVKNIHWRATARTNKVYVKSYEEDRQLNIMLVIDLSNSTNFGLNKSKHDKIIEFAALVSVLAQKGQDAVGMCLFSDVVEEYFRPKKSRHQFQQMLGQLLKHRTLAKGTDLKEALNYIRNHQRKKSIIFIVSDFICDDYQQELRLLAIAHDVVCVQVIDDIDTDLPKGGIVTFQDAESGKRMLLDTSNRAVRVSLKSSN